MELSVIVPVYNEEESINPLYTAITAAVAVLDLSYEILFVDDGSKDQTFTRAKELANEDHQVRVIRFRKNYGQTPAMVAGIEHARGKIVVTMDGDLQNDPADIPELLNKIEEGYDIAVGWRYKRQDKLITRKIPSKVANWLIGKVTGVPIKDNGCSLKAYRAEVIKSVPLYSEMHRFIPAMLSLTGAKIAEIKVRHHARKFGTSKYGLSRIYKVLMDLLTIKTIISFSTRPLVWFGIPSTVSFLVSVLSIVFTLIRYLYYPNTALIVPLGLSMVFGALGMFLMFCGVLSVLIHNTGSFKVEKLSEITTQNI